MKIGPLFFDRPIFLAPMAGVTDTPYRILAHEMGCPLAFSEMVSAIAINFQNTKTLAMLEKVPEEGPIALQLFGHEPESVARAARYVTSLGRFAVIDFNMGCPAPKVVKSGAGAALLLDIDRAAKIMAALRKATSLPVTVKMRLGWDKNHIVARELAQQAEAAGIDAIAVHGRTREDYYRGRADWSAIAAIKKAVSLPVIANGDIRTPTDLKRCLTITGADGVMIGRAAEGNPWIFRELGHFYETGEEPAPPTKEERAALIMRHLDLLVKFKGDYIGPREMRKHAMWYTKGLTGAAAMREEFSRAEKRTDFLAIIEKYIVN